MAPTHMDGKWPGSDNLFWNPITRGIVASVEISYAYLTILDGKRTEGATQLLMYNDYLPRHNNLEAKSGLKGSDLMSQKGYTAAVVDNFDLIQGKLSHFQDETVVAGFGTGSFVFKQIWGVNLNRFYRGSRVSKEGAFSSTATSMSPYPALAALAIEIRAFHDTELVGAVHSQHLKMESVNTDQTAVLDAQINCAKGMDKGLGWAKILFADEAVVADRERKIDSCFPLALIKRHKNLEHLGIVSAGAFKEIVLHGFKVGEKVKIMVDGPEDLLFMLMPTSKYPCPPTALKVVAGTTIEDLATILGDLANRHLMVTNTSLTDASHYDLTIIEA